MDFWGLVRVLLILVPSALAVYVVYLGRRKPETLAWALGTLRVILWWALLGATAAAGLLLLRGAAALG